MTGKAKNEFVGTGTIREIHKLLRNWFAQAIKWELMEKNPCQRATVPKHTPMKREIWGADTMMHAMDVCKDEKVVIACNLIFACTLRPGEVTGLTWDCMDISPEAIEEDRAYIIINKELQRVTKEALKALDGKDVLLVFPETKKSNKTVRILKKPKTEDSERKIFLPKTVALMLVEWKKKQEQEKEVLGEEYMDFKGYTKYTRARSRKIVDKPAITRYSIDSKSGQLNIVIIPAGTGMVADPMCRC